MSLVYIFQLFILVFFSLPASAGEWKVHFLNVGFGDASIIKGPEGHTTLIDAGGPGTHEKITQFLSQQGIDFIDTVVLTHPHENHCGGLMGLMPVIRSSEILFNGGQGGDKICEDTLQGFIQNGFTIKTIKANDVIFQGEGYILSVLFPSTLGAGINEDSLVLWLELGSKGFLFTADIGLAQQETVLREFPFIAQADIVQVPHHGDQLSDSWVNSFKWANFIISSGKNPYGLPSSKTLDVLAGSLYQTEEGDITITSDGMEVSIAQHL